MSKRRFLRELRLSISHLPKSEVDKAISYYSECIEDMLDDGMSEDEAVSSLDNIANIVSTIEEIAEENGAVIDYNKKVTSVDSEIVDDEKKSYSNERVQQSEPKKAEHKIPQYINGKRVDGSSLGKDISSSIKIAMSSKMRAAANKIASVATNMDEKQKNRNNYSENKNKNYYGDGNVNSQSSKKKYNQSNGYSHEDDNIQGKQKDSNDDYYANQSNSKQRNYADYEYEPSVYDKSKSKVHDVVTKKRSTTANVLLGITSIIWAPILLALIVAGSAVAFGLFISVIALSLSLVLIVLSIGVGGVLSIIQGAFLAGSGMVHAGVAAIGIGLVLFAISMLLAKPSVKISGKLLYGILGLIKAGYNMIFRRRAKVWALKERRKMEW